jgi:hypothetical protein
VVVEPAKHTATPPYRDAVNGRTSHCSSRLAEKARFWRLQSDGLRCQGEPIAGVTLTAVAVVISTRRDEILARWLEVTGLQSFHAGRGRKAVGHNIPALFDALVSVLQRSAPRWVDAPPPPDPPAVVQTAQAHAKKRFEQGLQTTDLVTEFRLLRQEIGRALRLRLEMTASLPAMLLVLNSGA